MSDKIIKHSGKVLNSNQNDRLDENSGFKSALSIKPALQSVDHHGQDIPEGLENINLCPDSFYSESKKRSSDSKICELNFKDCISSDLLKRLEESSPIKSKRTLKGDRANTNFMTNYSYRNDDELDEEEVNTEVHKNLYRNPESLFYGRNNPENEMDKFYLMEDNGEFEAEKTSRMDNFTDYFESKTKVNEDIHEVSDNFKENRKAAPNINLHKYGNCMQMENILPDQNTNYTNLFPFQNYFIMDKENPIIKENIGNFIKNNQQFTTSDVPPQQNIHQKYGSPDDDRMYINKSHEFKRFYHLDEDISFYPKNYNPEHRFTPTNNSHKFRDFNNPNNFNLNHMNSYNDSSFSQSVNNLFKKKTNTVDSNFNNCDDQKFNSLIFTEDARKPETIVPNLIKNSKVNGNKFSIISNDTNTNQSPLFTPNITKKVNKHQAVMLNNNENTYINQSNTNNQNLIKENNSTKTSKSNHIVNSKSYLNGKFGWVCNNCKNFNYETRIKCNRCGRHQIKNQHIEKENNSISTNIAIEKPIPPTVDKSDIYNCANSANMIYNKNPKYANNHIKISHIHGTISKENHINKKVSVNTNEINKNENLNDPTLNIKLKESPSSEISKKANSTDSKKKKKPFVERVGDWVCIKCKNLNFSFRVICNRCQLTKTESENLFEQYMKNLMNYVKLNEILQNQIFNSSNNNNILELNGLNNQLILNMNKTIQQKKLQIPNDPNMLNYLKNKSLNSKGFSPKTNFSTEGSNSNLGIIENHYNEDSPGDKLGNKSK